MTNRFFSGLGALALGAMVLLHGSTAPLAQHAGDSVPIAPEVSRILQVATQPVPLLLAGDPVALRAAAARVGAPVRRALDGFLAIDATAAQVAALRLDPAVALIAGDVRVTSAMAVTRQTIGADRVHQGTASLAGVGYPAVTGAGIGVAVVDSGIAPHRALTGKVLAAKSFVPGDTRTTDLFGHGTHIAGLIAGSGAKTPSVYGGGVAPGAHLINVRVLNAQGSGLVSDVLAGLDWVVANRAAYGIRIVNLSLGHPPAGPCAVDPLCTSVQRLVQAGLVVVASAGNRGAAPSGQLLFGTVSSPGNSPFALTVGALNTWGTATRDDDTVTSYSSRGPAPYDVLVKPDVVAPGNKLVSLEAAGSTLAKLYPQLHVTGSSTNAYSRMSGTSMAAGVVSGSVALLLQAAPGLAPVQAKLALQLTASPTGDGFMTSGTGSIDVWAARKSVGNQLTTAVSSALPLAAAQRFAFVDTGRLMNQLHQGQSLVIGSLRTLLMLVGGNPLVDALYSESSGAIAPAQMLWGDQLSNSTGEQILWGEERFDIGGQQILWGDQILWGEQILWGDQTTQGTQILWGDQSLWGDQILWGDETTHGTQILWGDTLVNGEAR